MTERTYFHLDDLRELMDPKFVNEQKVNCIKYIRRMTGVNLREAKDFVEQEWIDFVNGKRKIPKSIEVQTLITDCEEFTELQKQVARLTDEVANLRANQIKTKAKGIFNEDS